MSRAITSEELRLIINRAMGVATDLESFAAAIVHRLDEIDAEDAAIEASMSRDLGAGVFFVDKGDVFVAQSISGSGARGGSSL